LRVRLFFVGVVGVGIIHRGSGVAVLPAPDTPCYL